VFSVLVTITMMSNKYMSLVERKKSIQEDRCFVCLRTGHFSKNCPSLRKRCDHCGKQGRHNRCFVS